MTELVVRRLLIDLETPFAARWNGGDAFRSAFFSALSMSFPAGEQYFIDSVRNGLATLPAAARDGLAAEIKGFVGQEATHRRLHALFNGHLERMGYYNEIERRALRRMEKNAHRDARVHVAATAATEHFTAIFADWLLCHPEALAGAEERLRTLWEWHGAEESEHRSTAFDLYKAMGGNQSVRTKIFYYISAIFLIDLTRQTLRNLWHDGSLLRMASWKSAWRLLFARDGMFRGNLGLWRDYLAPEFHPAQNGSGRARLWLQEHAADYSVNSAGAPG